MSLLETIKSAIHAIYERNRTPMINSPIKWVGGKSRLRKKIIALLPEHTCYVEPFAGAAWVLFGKEPSPVEVINDIDNELINFFNVIKYKPEEFLRSFDWTLVSRSEFEHLSSLDISDLSDVERAYRFYYLIMAGWGGEFKYPRFQTSISDGGHGNRLIGAIKNIHNRIEPVYKRLQTVIIENLDWTECIDKYDRNKVVMYIDPPYLNNGANYAHNMRDWEAHHQLAERLLRSKSKWILSAYDKPEIYEQFSQNIVIPVEAASGMRIKKNNTKRVKNKEVLILNFDPPENSSLQDEIFQNRLNLKSED